MNIFVYRVNNRSVYRVNSRSSYDYLIYFQDEMGKWRLITVYKCPTKKITRKFISRFPNFVSSAPKGSIGKPSFFYENAPTDIYTLVQSYNITTLMIP